MNHQHFGDDLAQKVSDNGPLFIGIDPILDVMPRFLHPRTPSRGSIQDTLQQFCRLVIENCGPYASGVKFQSAYFEVWGIAGLAALAYGINLAKQCDLIVILDVKRGDIGSTSEAYGAAYLSHNHELPGGGDGYTNELVSDAITVSPYLGLDTLEVFFRVAKKGGKGVFVLLRTSNPGSGFLQNAVSGDETVWRKIADFIHTADVWGKSGYGNFGVVVGATLENTREIREEMPDTWFLVPGYGHQGGTKKSVSGLMDRNRSGIILPVSRALTYGSSADSELAYGKDLRQRGKSFQREFLEIIS